MISPEKAKAFLEDEDFKSVFSELEKAIINRWKNAGIDDKVEQTKCKLLLVTLNDFRRYFEGVVRDGKVNIEKQTLKQKLGLS